MDEVKAVLFDMDGVVVESEQYWHEVEKGIIEDLERVDRDEVIEEVTGRNYQEAYELLVEEYGLEMDRDEFIGQYDDAAEVIYGERVELMEGFRSMARELQDRGLAIGLVSSSPRRWIGIVLERFDLEGYFDRVISAEDIEGEGKPEPDIYFHAAEELDVDPEDCVVVEDSENGIEAAERAGMYCIGYRNRSERADEVAGSPEELRTAILDRIS